MEFLADQYLLIKAVHIIFVIFWMAGLLMVPRFFAYHHTSASDSDESQKWIEREARLFKIILNPGMIITLILGLLLVTITGVDQTIWFSIKFVLVIMMMGFHMMMAGQRKKFARGERPKSEKYFRIMNEVPSILIIIIVMLAVVKPF